VKVNGTIPLVDLVAPHRELEEELVAVFREALESAGFVGGPMLADFEREFARFCGTDALRFALLATGIEPGSIVVTVPNSFIATTEAITQAGAYPDFVDVDENTASMDPAELERYLVTQCEADPQTGKLVHRRTGRKVAGVVPVHLFGQPADMDPILELSRRHRLLVIEDACQAHGAEYFSEIESRWKKAGSIGHAAAFSFYPGKNLGACGEGGAVTTDDETVAQTVRMLRDHGQAKKYYHEREGYNGRLDAIQAGVLGRKLPHLPEWNGRRREVARRYRLLFEAAREALLLPEEPSWARGVYHLYVVRVANRDQVRDRLQAAGIGTGIHYPIPLHLQQAYHWLGYGPGDFPVAERLASESLSLPMYPQLTAEQQQSVVERLLEAVAPVTKVSASA
jgi:dTDP-4-amino-4,6-dideoxygalactose transaminase